MIFINQVVRTHHHNQQLGCHQHIDCRHVPTVGGAVAGGAIAGGAIAGGAVAGGAVAGGAVAGGAVAGCILNTHSWGTNNRMQSLIMIINNKII